MSPTQVVVPLALATAAPALGGVVRRLDGRSMGTTWSAAFVVAPRTDTAPLRDALQAELDVVVAQMSPWQPASALSRFNAAPAGSWHPLPSPFFEVLAFGTAVASQSDGACDPTIGALVDLWGFGPARRYDAPGFAAPSAEAIASALQCSGWQRLTLDPLTRRARQPGGLRLDLSAIAKGFAVDRLALQLRGRGIESWLVEVGGELRGAGVKPDGQPWWVALEAPPPCERDAPPLAAEPAATVVALHGLAIATSGDYRRVFTQAGVRFSHTIDPRDGRPIRHGLASVTVLHAECMAADAWSTALGVMGAERGLAVAERLGLAARFVTRRAGGLDERCSAAFAAMLE